MNKICIICNIEKDIINFPIRKGSKDGYRNDCKACKRERDKKFKNKDNDKRYSKIWRAENKDRLKQYQSEYNKINKDKLNERNRVYMKNRLMNDPLFKFSKYLNNLIRTSFRNKNYTKNSKTFDILGLSYEDAFTYIENKFEPWMTWENYGLYNGELQYGWDIDHIKPLSTATCEEEVIKLNHYTNLQPLCSKINRVIKRDNVNY